MIVRWFTTVVCVALMAASGCAANPLNLNSGRAGQPILREGRMHFADGGATADIVTRPATPQENIAGHITACSSGWQSCALVDRLMLKVGGAQFDVPHRARLMISDVSRGRLTRATGGYELDLSGGDAADAYEAHIFFDRTSVRRVDIWASEARMLEQRTKFHDLSHAFH